MLKLTRCVAGLVLVAGIYAFAATPQANAAVTKTGILSRFDFVNPAGYYYEIHNIRMKSGTTYRIELSSSQFDTYLIVENKAGRSLAENDDIAPGNLNSRLFFRPPYAGWYTYRVRVTTFSPRKGGAFTLRITP